MNNNVNIIADIAGQYKALVELVHKMPQADEIISLGDMIDRGPDSQRVLDFFMQPGRRAILGNHEHMMLDYCKGWKFYGSNIWQYNGGTATLNSFDCQHSFYKFIIPNKYLKWVESLPKYIEIDDVLLTHAFLSTDLEDDKECLLEDCRLGKSIYDKDEYTILWNRRQPFRRKTWKLQICGHNSQFGLREWRDEEGLYAMCLDDSRKNKLTGLHLPTMEVFQVNY